MQVLRQTVNTNAIFVFCPLDFDSEQNTNNTSVSMFYEWLQVNHIFNDVI